MSVRECLRVMRCLHLALATILARITGFREDIIPLFGFWAWGGFPGIGTHPVKCFLENRRFFCNDFFHNDQVDAFFLFENTFNVSEPHRREANGALSRAE